MTLKEMIYRKKIVIFSHSCEDTTGVDDELDSFLKQYPLKELILIKFPFTFSRNGSIRVSLKKDNSVKNMESFIRFYKPQHLSYVKDMIYAFYYGMRYCRQADLFVATSNILVCIGLILKKLGVVKKVVYYMIDFTPVRFGNPLVNTIYDRVDRMACYGADRVWPLSQAMIDARFVQKHLKSENVNFFLVPSGNDSNKFSDEDQEHHDKKNIIYFGGILKSKGAELFVPITKELIARRIKKFTFICVGGGDIEYLKQEIKQAKLQKYFRVLGRIDDMEKVEKILLSGGVAVAPYYPEDRNNFSYYADPGKIKHYLGCGLPVVITDVPPVAREIADKKGGLIAEYKAKDFAEKIKYITSNQKRYYAFQKNAMHFGRHFTWNNIYKKALENIL